MERYLRDYYTKIVVLNDEEDIDKFYFISKNINNKQVLIDRLIHILIYYKSFVNYSKTIECINLLKEGNLNSLDGILDYVTSRPYCRIIRYKEKFMGSKVELEGYDYNITDINIHNYKNKYYSNKDLEKGLTNIFNIRLEKYNLKDDLIDEDDMYLKIYYTEKILFYTNN